MKVLIGVATYRRPEKLKRLLRSLRNQTYPEFDVYVICDNNDIDSLRALADWENPLFTCVKSHQSFVIGCWNEAFRLRGYDAYLMLCDDVELFSDCVEVLITTLPQRFPDLDGVIGLTQECPGRPDYTYRPFGQTMMGSKFVDRYKSVDYQVCCPYYTHFYQDQEMYQYSLSMRKFYHSPEAKLYHYHPAFRPEERDSTHDIVRVPHLYQKDVDTFKRRQAAGKLWGRTWEE